MRTDITEEEPVPRGAVQAWPLWHRVPEDHCKHELPRLVVEAVVAPRPQVAGLEHLEQRRAPDWRLIPLLAFEFEIWR